VPGLPGFHLQPWERKDCKVRETLVKNKMQTKRVEHLPSKLKVLDLGFHAQYHKNKNKKLFKKRNFSENTLN
jgi:hypothetical protein